MITFCQNFMEIVFQMYLLMKALTQKLDGDISVTHSGTVHVFSMVILNRIHTGSDYSPLTEMWVAAGL
jgi:hypothetical protein